MIVHKLPADRQAAVDVFLRMAAPGKIFILQTLHDDHCPCIRTQREEDCARDCSPEHYILEAEPSDGLVPVPGYVTILDPGGGGRLN